MRRCSLSRHSHIRSFGALCACIHALPAQCMTRGGAASPNTMHALPVSTYACSRHAATLTPDALRAARPLLAQNLSLAALSPSVGTRPCLSQWSHNMQSRRRDVPHSSRRPHLRRLSPSRLGHSANGGARTPETAPTPFPPRRESDPARELDFPACSPSPVRRCVRSPRVANMPAALLSHPSLPPVSPPAPPPFPP